jgi:hypothetical protein
MMFPFAPLPFVREVVGRFLRASKLTPTSLGKRSTYVPMLILIFDISVILASSSQHEVLAAVANGRTMILCKPVVSPIIGSC